MPKLDRLPTLILQLRQEEQHILRAMKNDEDHKVRKVSRSSIDLLYKLEDAIEHLSLQKESGAACRAREFINTKKEILEISTGVENLSRISTALVTPPPPGRTNKLLRVGTLKHGLPAKKNLVGRDDDMKDLRSKLARDSPCRLVVICGMGGVGKTSLAANLCSDLKSEYTVAFVSLSQNPSPPEIWKELYKQVSGSNTNQDFLDKQNLEDEVLGIIKDKSWLVFLDDMWFQDAEDLAEKALTRDEFRSKFLITTRDAVMEESFDKRFGKEKAAVHRLRQLSQSEGAKLFQTRFIRQAQDFEANENLDKIAEEVAKLCGSVPLAIINFTRYMESKLSEERATILQDIGFYVRKSREVGNVDSIIERLLLTYANLTDNLKQCFLYLGAFENESWIHAEKLCLFWMVERLIALGDNIGSAEKKIMKDEAEGYLLALAKKNMIEVEEEEIPNFIGIKSWKINLINQELSLLKSREQGFLEVLDLEYKRDRSPEYQSYRLAINLDNDERYALSLLYHEMKHIRCLLLRAKKDWQKNEWPRELSTFVHFKYLRILDFDGFDFRVIKLPRKIKTLIHLKFLSFNGCILPELPSSIGNLRSLLVLDLRVLSESKIIIPNILWKLKKLIHLFFPESFCTKDGCRLRLEGMKELESIINFNSGMLNFEDLFHLDKLQYVASKIEENINDIESLVKGIEKSDGKSMLQTFHLELSNFDCYTAKKHSLFRCILKWNSLSVFCMAGHIYRLPGHSEISPNLAKIVLKGSQLANDPMKILEKLQKLVVLELTEDAFVKKEMICSASGFVQLKHLELVKLKSLEEWIVEDGAMPKLSKLIIKSCGKLIMFPEKLGFDSSHQEAKISGMPKKSMAILGKKSGTIKFVLQPTMKEDEVAQADFCSVTMIPDSSGTGYPYMKENGSRQVPGKPEEERRIVPEMNGKKESSLDGGYDDHGRMKTGSRGLENLGNTCYMNSVVQCLAHTPPLVQYFLKKFPNENNNEKPLTHHGELALAFFDLLWQLQSSLQIPVSPRPFKEKLLGTRFGGNGQQDSQEFLDFLLDKLQEAESETKDSDGQVADEFGGTDKATNDSIIQDIFQGQEKSTLVCNFCKKNSEKLDLFKYLSLALQSDGKGVSLYSCLDAYSKDEILHSKNMWDCPGCKQKRQATKKLDLRTLPEILIFHLKRFLKNPQGETNKLDTLVEFPIHDLNMKNYVSSKGASQGSHAYELFAISNHYGTLAAGHYTAYCKLIDNERWYCFDDSIVSPVDESKIRTSAAYLLFYQRVKTSTGGATVREPSGHSES